jgi:hypothetical protein
MTVIITGDVHQAIGSSDQRFVDRSESALAVDYARIADRYGVKVTLLFTGRAIVEDGAEAQALLEMENVEIGGHGWDALRPIWWHAALRRLTGSPHGPAWLQQRMIRRACAVIEQYTGRQVRSWRNHAYRYDCHTPRLLAQAGVSIWSDRVQLEHRFPRRHPSGIVILPINTLPDHEHLYHGARMPQQVVDEGYGPSYMPDLWYDRVCIQIEEVACAGGTATLLVHPICMKVADDFATFERLCAFLSNYPSRFASEAADQPCDR